MSEYNKRYGERAEYGSSVSNLFHDMEDVVSALGVHPRRGQFDFGPL